MLHNLFSFSKIVIIYIKLIQTQESTKLIIFTIILYPNSGNRTVIGQLNVCSKWQPINY